jgi:hypothetical protein
MSNFLFNAAGAILVGGLAVSTLTIALVLGWNIVLMFGGGCK